MAEPKKFRFVEADSEDVDNASDFETDGENAKLVRNSPNEQAVSICGVKFSSLTIMIIGGVLFAGVVTLGLLISIALGLNDNMVPAIFVRGAVASDSGVCSEIGYNVLKRNGSAVDSSIATMTCLGVVWMHSAGIGGGGVMMIRNASGHVMSIDYRESAPGSASRDMFVGNAAKAKSGGLAVAIPGQLKGLSLAHKLHGRLSWSSLIQPSVNLARNGFKLEKPTYDWASRMSAELVKNNPRLYQILYNGDGTQRGVGTVVKLPRLADLLQVIADSGSGDVVYNGSTVSQNIVSAVKAAGGVLTLQDLASYKATIRPALDARIRSHHFYTSPPPSSGATLLSMLEIVSGYGVLSDSALSVHRIIEAMKFAFVRRAELGDPDFESSVAAAVAKMISQEESDRLRLMIRDNTTHPLSFYGPASVTTAAPGTAHASVQRGEQEAVSVTESIGSPFGSFVGTTEGILLNNAMNDFSIPGSVSSDGFPAAEVNFIKPHKRPLSSVSPTIVTHVNMNDTVGLRVVAGAGGGPAIPSTVLQVLLNMLDEGNDVSLAVRSKRIFQQLSPDLVTVEEGFSESVVASLRDMGHVVLVTNQSIGHCSAVYQNDASPRQLSAASDQRDGGIASYGALFKLPKN